MNGLGVQEKIKPVKKNDKFKNKKKFNIMGEVLKFIKMYFPKLKKNIIQMEKKILFEKRSLKTEGKIISHYYGYWKTDKKNGYGILD